MRNLLIIGASLLAAAPALAQPPVEDRPLPPPAYEEDYEADDLEAWDYAAEDGGAALDVLTSPQTIEQSARMLDRLMGAVMGLPIGGILTAVDPYGRAYPPSTTVRDVAVAGDPEAEARIRDGIRGSTRSMVAMGDALRRAMPALRRSIEDIQHSLEGAIGEADREQGDR